MSTSIEPANRSTFWLGGEKFRARLVILAISGSLLAVCVFVALPAVFTDTSRWPATEGVLVQVVEIGAGLKGRLRIRYVYEVDGRSYTNRRAALWTDSVPLPAVRQSRKDWRPGARVRVFHHPTHPERSVLDPYVGPARKAGVIFGTVLSIAGVVGAFRPGPHSRREP